MLTLLRRLRAALGRPRCGETTAGHFATTYRAAGVDAPAGTVAPSDLAALIR